MARTTRAPVPLKPIPLKTIHTYPSKNGTASINIFSYPQRVPTFMGGSYERDWGSLAGSVDIKIHEASGDRVSAIKLTLTAIQVITVPKAASVDAPSALDRMAIDTEETKTKQVTLLELEQILFEPLKSDVDRDANLLPQGKHVYPFSINLPLLGNKDKKNPPLLPPSCVIEPLLQGPTDAKLRQAQASTGLFGRSKANEKGQLRPAWATVKYQLKLTVQRPGMLKRNVRSYAPFVYLPPPPSAASSLLLQRRALGAQMAAIVIERQGDGCQPMETPQDWRQRLLPFLLSPNGQQKLEPEKKTGFLSHLFGGTKKPEMINWHEAWTFSMPMSGRSSFPLRSAIPFIVRCTTNKPIDLSMSSPLAFKLYRRVRLLTGKKQKAVAMQQEPVAEAVLRYAVESRGVHRINGVIPLPPNCVPSFDLPSLSLDYFVAVVRLLDGSVLHKEAVNLACPPPVEPKTAYGPYPSGLAWRSAREAALSPPESPSSPEESPPLAPHASSSPTALAVPSPSSRQRPSFSSIASTSSSSAHANSRRTSVTPSFRSYRTGSTDSTHYASAASSVNHANAGNTAAAAAVAALASGPTSAPMGLAGMANPPPASSAGASGLAAHAPYSSNLDPVREQSRAFSVRDAPSSPIPQAAPTNTAIVVHDASDTASIASSTRRRHQYSSRGATPIPPSGSTRSSVDHEVRPDASRYVHVHEKVPPTESMASLSMSRSVSMEGSNSRRGLFAANAEDLPSIPAQASSSAREQANALVGASSSRPRRDGRADRERRTSSRSRAEVQPSTSSTKDRRRNAGTRPLPATPADPPSSRSQAQAQPPPPPAPTVADPVPQQPVLLDPAAVLTNEDLMYGEDMELDLPPSYFEAVHGAEEEDEDG
ncbi:hypothetical protein PHSY_001735 [Pseudozyma hubeiensis SY62]|uniref:Arrestin-like N-terminal domain-containing protein n=1 Tax=Pseudozyma hubeiensis (strain SY62) TaxID=1305764 RepID=R9NZG1_PSEHS|nr:hypothetical protein PHSY_001735 [Pseudozyma hubeiensis SY62]GAC94164.1 hypothetical protein PHSY_001735 [Pseudozyma hubeiensis SY62]